MAVVAMGFGSADHRSMMRGNSTVVSRIAQIVNQFGGGGSADGSVGADRTFSSCETRNYRTIPDEQNTSQDSARTINMAASGVYNLSRQNGEAAHSPPREVKASQPSCPRTRNHSTFIGLPPRYQAVARTDLPPDLDLGRYTLVGLIGKGTFGTVVRARNMAKDPPEDVAIKLLPRGAFVKNFKTYVKREVAYQASLCHPLIVSLREVFLTTRHLALAMDFMPGGDLYKYVIRHEPHCRLSEPQARWIFQQLIIGLDFCHRKGVANRDLKMENLLLDRDGCNGTRPLLKICDFGVSKHVDDSSAKTTVGTPVCMAPEVIYGGPRYDAQKSDIWSCGVILYAMVYGQYPFDMSDKDYFKRIINGIPMDPPPDVHLSLECMHLMSGMIVPDPQSRMSLEQIMVHPWFLQDLPAGTLGMNTAYLNQPFDHALHEAVEYVVEAAQQPYSPDEQFLSLIFEPPPTYQTSRGAC